MPTPVMTSEEARWLEAIYPLLVRIATAKLGAEDGKDIVQNTATAILRNLDQARRQRNRTKWAVRILLNKITDHWRCERRRRCGLEAAAAPAAPRLDPERTYACKELLQRLDRTARARLSTSESEIYELMRGERSSREIAQVRQTTFQTAKKQVVEIRKKLLRVVCKGARGRFLLPPLGARNLLKQKPTIPLGKGGHQ